MTSASILIEQRETEFIGSYARDPCHVTKIYFAIYLAVRLIATLLTLCILRLFDIFSAYILFQSGNMQMHLTAICTILEHAIYSKLM